MASREPRKAAIVATETGLEFSILSYFPSIINQHGINIAVIVVGGGSAEVQFVPDWKSVLAIDPLADVELLTSLADEIRETLKSPYEGDKLLGTMQLSWSNAIRLSTWKGCLTDDRASEMEKLAAQYLA